MNAQIGYEGKVTNSTQNFNMIVFKSQGYDKAIAYVSQVYFYFYICTYIADYICICSYIYVALYYMNILQITIYVVHIM